MQRPAQHPPRSPVRGLLPAAALAALSLGWWACGDGDVPGPGKGPESASQPDAPAPQLRPYAVQLHVHGSFSEGLGSIDSQSHEATDLGLDTLWWSDHDWRIASYHTLSHFSFEAPGDDGSGPPAVEQDRLGDWSLTDARFEPKFAPLFKQVTRRTSATGDVRHSTERAHDGSHSYQITAASLAPEFRDYVAQLSAPMPGYRRPLAAGLRVSFALWYEGLGDDARAWIELRLSEHPVPEGASTAAEDEEPRDYEPLLIRYVLGDPAAEPYREGPVLWVPLDASHGPADPAEEGAWHTYAVELSADAAAGFPELVSEDNSLTALNVGLSIRNGEAVTLFIDDVRIDADLRGAPMFERQREVIEQVAQRYPGLTQLQGVEISYLHPHLNEFSIGTELLDYDALAEASGLLNGAREVSEAELRGVFARTAIERAHARGGLVSFNHFLGTDPEGRSPERPRDEVLAELLEHRLYGADLLEVGYRDRGGHPIRNHLWAWDRLALDGELRPVGIGVTDHHGGPERARTMANNFVTWVWSTGPGKAELIEGLRAGRAFFGDPTEFKGTLELTSERGQSMGQIVLSDRRSVELDIAIDGLAATDRVIVVESGELARFLDVESEQFESRQTIELAPAGGFVRVEAFARSGTALVFSNPIHFVRSVPAGGLDPARSAVDVEDVRSVSLGDLRITEARPVSGETWRGLRLVGEANGGTVVLDAPGVTDVELKGLEGRVDLDRGRVTVRDLSGQGRLILKRAR